MSLVDVVTFGGALLMGWGVFMLGRQWERDHNDVVAAWRRYQPFLHATHRARCRRDGTRFTWIASGRGPFDCTCGLDEAYDQMHAAVDDLAVHGAPK